MISAQVDSNWLTLGQASRMLGVHPTTLRGWVDAGLLRAFLTPGGHRRFKESELREFLIRRGSAPVGDRMANAEQTIEQVRAQLHHIGLGRQPWYQRLSDRDRNHHRATGARLLGLLLRYVGQQGDPDESLAQARLVAREYGNSFAGSNASVSELAQAFLLFRRMIVHAACTPDSRVAMRDDEGMHFMTRIDEFMDELLIATLDAFEQATMGKSRAVDESRNALLKSLEIAG